MLPCHPPHCRPLFLELIGLKAHDVAIIICQALGSGVGGGGGGSGGFIAGGFNGEGVSGGGISGALLGISAAAGGGGGAAAALGKGTHEKRAKLDTSSTPVVTLVYRVRLHR